MVDVRSVGSLTLRGVKRGRAVLGIFALATLIGCGESHPSAESSDDTRSVVDADIPTITTLAATSVGDENVTDEPVESGVVIDPVPETNTTAMTVAAPAATVGSAVTTPITSAPPATPAPPATALPPVIPCDAVPDASCAGADLRGQELMFANLQGADFRGANLAGVDLSGADLSGANFTGASLTNANLSETVLFGTDFTGVRLSRTNLQFVLWDDSTIWPSGFTPPDF